MKFYICEHCKNIVAYVENHGPAISCCGEKMKELIPNTVDASNEKHVPVVEVNGTHVHVKVGSIAHPMENAHYITWIALETTNGNQRKELAPGHAPEANFALVEGEKVLAVYEYCNLHGLWKTTL